MFETIQGEGGVMPLTKEFVAKINEIAVRDDVLMIVDEVQTGNGRTGELFGYMNYGIKPDIVTTAKGLGGGLPIGATLLGEKVENVFVPGSHGSTFGGNPVCAAGAISVIERIDEKLLADVKRKSEYIFKSLEGVKGVKSVSGMGLMIGIETERKNTDILAEAREKGVLALSAKTKVRLLPPLNITDELLAEAIDILKEIIAK
jgi:acetylornithine/N-succinyldiaminopimelate aminotransferase